MAMKIIETDKNWKFCIKESAENNRQRVAAPFEPLTQEIFESCPFKDKIFQNQDVLFIITVGSSLNGLTDSYSDYDLIVITEEHYEDPNDYRLIYNDRIIHWYYRTLEELYTIEDSSDDFLRLLGLFQFRFLTEDNLLYLNSKHKKDWAILLKHTCTLSNLGFNLSCRLMRQWIDVYFNKKTPSKFYHKIANVYYTMSGELKDIDFLLRVKRINQQPLTADDAEKLKNIFENLLQLLPTDEQIKQNIAEARGTLISAWQYHRSVILVHFPENGHHGCGKHCSFCLFDKLDYNIPIKPTDDEIIAFIQKTKENGYVQICGAGDPLYNFNKNKEYLKHIIDIIHKYNHPVELVTKYVELVDQYFETELTVVDKFSFSIETLDAAVLNLINRITNFGKKVRISKVANFTEDIYDVDWNFLEKYAAFYSQIEHKELLAICYRPNYNYSYRDKDVKAVQYTINNWGDKYNCFIYMHAQSSHIITPQLWNGREIPCSDTGRYIFEDMGLDFIDNEK